MGILVHSELDRNLDPRRVGKIHSVVFNLDPKGDKVAGPNRMSNSRRYANVIHKCAVCGTDVLDIESLHGQVSILAWTK